MKATVWVERHGVTFDWSATGYQRDPGGWEHHAYIITLTRAGADPVELPWRQGMAIDDEPTPETVLPAVASDVEAGGVTFEEFAGDFGYDADSLSAYRTWESCRDLRRKLYDFAPSQAAWEEFLEIREDEDQ